jgi:hypothetical protein
MWGRENGRISELVMCYEPVWGIAGISLKLEMALCHFELNLDGIN